MSIQTFLKQIQYEHIEVEDEILEIEINDPATSEQLERFERKNTILPSELKDLLSFSNGMFFFGLHIQSLDEIEYDPDEKIFSFHNWGSGDFDWVSSVSNKIFFSNHSIYNLAEVDGSLSSWFRRSCEEIKKMEFVLHPLDYEIEDFKNHDGLYKKVFTELKNKNGEIYG